MKKLNEVTSNELLFELKNTYGFDWIDDSVCVTFYANHEHEKYKIGRAFMLESIGEWLLEKHTVKGFSIKVRAYKDGTSYDIDIILNI